MGERFSGAQPVSDIDAQGNFNGLQCVHEDQAKLLIEVVQIHCIVELRSRFEQIRFNVAKLLPARLPRELERSEWIPVAAEPVVTNMLQLMECPPLVTNVHAAAFEQIQLINE
ncbi:hypothetical protein NPS29_11510 [Pseudomonas putida]|nr:hypothetical protein [Pseudomonas putida]MDD1965948.1 hypothetical protein [Pseudomonas putida]